MTVRELRNRRAALILHLWLPPSGLAPIAPALVKAEYADGAMRKQVVFSDQPSVLTGLSPSMADAVTALIAQLPAIDVATQLDIAHTPAIDGLVLSRVRADISEPKDDGGRAVKLTWFAYRGALQNAFAAGVDLEAQGQAISAPQDATDAPITPFLNFSTSLGAVLDRPAPKACASQVDAHLAALERHASDLEQQAALLRRYVAGCAEGQSSYPYNTGQSIVLQAAEPDASSPNPPLRR